MHNIASTDVVLLLEALVDVLINCDNLLTLPMHRLCQVIDQHIPPNGFRLRYDSIANFDIILISLCIVCFWILIDWLGVHLAEELLPILICYS